MDTFKCPKCNSFITIIHQNLFTTAYYEAHCNSCGFALPHFKREHSSLEITQEELDQASKNEIIEQALFGPPGIEVNYKMLSAKEAFDKAKSADVTIHMNNKIMRLIQEAAKKGKFEILLSSRFKGDLAYGLGFPEISFFINLGYTVKEMFKEGYFVISWENPGTGTFERQEE